MIMGADARKLNFLLTDLSMHNRTDHKDALMCDKQVIPDTKSGWTACHVYLGPVYALPDPA